MAAARLNSRPLPPREREVSTEPEDVRVHLYVADESGPNPGELRARVALTITEGGVTEQRSVDLSVDESALTEGEKQTLSNALASLRDAAITSLGG